MNQNKRAQAGIIVLVVVIIIILIGLGIYYSTRSTPVSNPTTNTNPTPTNSYNVMVTNGDYGNMLVNSQGFSLYIFLADSPNVSNCYGGCASSWPPLLVPVNQAPVGSSSVSGNLGTIQRTDGTYQVTVNGWPLYTFAGDAVAGTTNGQGLNNFGGSWYVVSPSGSAIVTTTSSTSPATNTSSSGSSSGSSGSGSGGSGYGY